MANNLRKFNNAASYNAATLVKPAVSWIEDTNTVMFDQYVPTPSFDGKYLVTYTGGTTYSAECDSTSAITSEDIAYGGNIEDLTSAVIGDCVTTFSSDFGGVFASCTSLTSVTIPNSVTSIGDELFSDCRSLTSVTIPNSVTTIGSYAFAYCSSLTSMTIPNSVTSIGMGAFGNCSSLTSVTIPSGVTSISRSAFEGCSSLTSITVNATTPPTLGSDAFYDTNDCPIYVPSASVSAYQSSWSDYASRIQAIQ